MAYTVISRPEGNRSRFTVVSRPATTTVPLEAQMMRMATSGGGADAARSAAAPVAEAADRMGAGEYALGLGANALQGAAMGFADEIAGVGTGIVGALPAALGVPGAPTYESGRDAFRAVRSDFAQRRPVAATIANVAGAIPAAMVLPVGAAAGELSTAARIGRGAAIGAGYGAVTGFGEGEGSLDQRMANAALYAGIGGVGGGALEFAAPYVGRALGLGKPAAVPEIRTQADALPVPVPMTLGQATDDVGALAREFSLYRGGEGAAGQGVMRDFAARQQDALMANRDALQQRLAGGGPMIARGEGGAAISGKLSGMADEANRTGNALYDEATRLTPPTALAERPFGNTETRGAIDRLYGGRRTDTPDANFAPTPLRAEIPQDTGQRMMARAWDELVKVDPTTKNAGGVSGLLREYGALADKGPVGIADVFQLRRSLTALQGGQPSADTAAARAAKGVLDKEIDGMIASDLLRGDSVALEAWKKAISGWKDYKTRFGSGDLIERLVERGPDGLLKIKPEDAANVILGWGKLGLNRRDLISGIGKLKTTLGENSPEFNALQQEYFIRLAESARGPQGPNGASFSGSKLASAWEDPQNKLVARVLLPENIRRDIGNWVNVARRVTAKDPAVYAPSVSATQLQRLGKLADRVLGRFLPYAGEILVGARAAAREARAAAEAARLTSGAMPAIAPSAGAAVPLIGTTAPRWFDQRR